MKSPENTERPTIEKIEAWIWCEERMVNGVVLGLVLGGLYGLIIGFQEHGIGGSLLFGLLGVVGGAIAGGLIVVIIQWSILLVILGGVIWLFIQLWGIGRL